MGLLSKALFPPLPYTEEVGEVGTVVVVVLVSLSMPANRAGHSHHCCPITLLGPPEGVASLLWDRD